MNEGAPLGMYSGRRGQFVGSSRLSDLGSAHVYNQTDGGLFQGRAELDGRAVSPRRTRSLKLLILYLGR